MLIDNLQVQSDDGARLFTLTRIETQTAMVALIKQYAKLVLVADEIDFDGSSGAGPEEAADPEESAESKVPTDPDESTGAEESQGVLKAIDRVSQIPLLAPEDGKRIITELRLLARQAKTPRPPLSLASQTFLACYERLARDPDFLDFLSFLRVYRVVLAPADIDQDNSKISITYESTRIGIGPQISLRRTRVVARAREFIGHTHFDLRFEIPLALRTPSYHFRFRAPQGQYVRLEEVLQPRYQVHGGGSPFEDWELKSLSISELNQQRNINRQKAFLEGDGSNSTDYAHLYMGNIRAHWSDATPRRIFVRVVVNEIPAGDTGRMLIRAVSAFTVMLAVWFLSNRIIGTQGAAVYAITILLALPSILSFGLLAGTDRTEPVMAPVSASVGTVISGLMAMVASIVFLWWALSNSTTTNSRTSLPALLFASLLIVQGVVMTFGLYRLLANVQRYSEAKSLANRSIVLPDGI
jgi:hypothetical protein